VCIVIFGTIIVVGLERNKKMWAIHT